LSPHLILSPKVADAAAHCSSAKLLAAAIRNTNTDNDKDISLDKHIRPKNRRNKSLLMKAIDRERINTEMPSQNRDGRENESPALSSKQRQLLSYLTKKKSPQPMRRLSAKKSPNKDMSLTAIHNISIHHTINKNMNTFQTFLNKTLYGSPKDQKASAAAQPPSCNSKLGRTDSIPYFHKKTPLVKKEQPAGRKTCTNS